MLDVGCRPTPFTIFLCMLSYGSWVLNCHKNPNSERGAVWCIPLFLCKVWQNGSIPQQGFMMVANCDCSIWQHTHTVLVSRGSERSLVIYSPDSHPNPMYLAQEGPSKHDPVAVYWPNVDINVLTTDKCRKWVRQDTSVWRPSPQ